MNKSMPRDLLTELTELYTFESEQPGDVSVASLSESLGVSQSTALRCLRAQVKEGRCIRVEVRLPSGRRGFVYRKPPGTTKEGGRP
jgi:predicted transcriptional regulator